MGNAAQREVLVKQRDDEGKKVAAIKLQKASWFQSLGELKSSIEGSLHTPLDNDGKYDQIRLRVWNKDQRGFPLVIVRAKNTSDVSNTVRFLRTRTTDVSICVASGCHGSNSMADNTIVVELSHLKEITFDQSSHTVHVGSGVLVKELDAALEPYNRVVPVGTYPNLGIAGLTLDGGSGWLTGLFGLTVDNLLEAEVVLNDGKVVIANGSNEFSDLLWALRGGGGNFGIVTRFTFQTHSLPPAVISGGIVKMAPTSAAAKTIVCNYDKAISDLPHELSSGVVLPAGAPVIITIWAHFGTETKPNNIPIIKNVPNYGGWPTVENSAQKNSYYHDLQLSNEKHNPESYNLGEVVPFGSLTQTLPEKLIEDLTSYLRQSLPAKVDTAAVILLTLGNSNGRIRDANNEKTAVPLGLRKCRYLALIQATWQPEHDKEGKEAARRWVNTVLEMLKPFSLAGESGGNIYGASPDLLHRLSLIKAKYDQENVFHMHQRPIKSATST